MIYCVKAFGESVDDGLSTEALTEPALSCDGAHHTHKDSHVYAWARHIITDAMLASSFLLGGDRDSLWSGRGGQYLTSFGLTDIVDRHLTG